MISLIQRILFKKEIQVKKGPLLWEKAKAIIPGGNQLLSKRSERFLPGHWPAYYKKAKGCKVWDLDENQFYDFAAMGVGACVLGYADPFVNEQVMKAVKNGSMSSLNSFEELNLAELLIKLHPWAGMCRFARSGGEACAIAIRIARAFSNRPNVAFCGYHGWHDWYISSNLAKSSNLDDQLLPGLSSRGLPRKLKDTAFPFQYNNLDQLKQIFSKHGKSIGTIIMEPVRDEDNAEKFLKAVRKIADKWNCVLIFDEITSGFRICSGGSHLVFGVCPDISVFGKAMGNGYPISAVVGKSEIMDAAQETFISSTFWTERIGFVGANATIEKFQKHNVWQNLIRAGNQIKEGWANVAKNTKLDIHISGISPLPHLSFSGHQSREKLTLFTQEMLKRGFLASSGPYTSLAHSPAIVNRYLEACEQSFGVISGASKKGVLSSLLWGEIASTGFQRLNSKR